MKLKSLQHADYDPTSKLLTITGQNSLGKTSKIELTVDDENAFLGWIISAIHSPHRRPSGGGKAIPADAIGFSLHADGAGGYQAGFTFSAGDLKLSFAAPIVTTAPERLAAIKGHLEQALAEMGHSEKTEKH